MNNNLIKHAFGHAFLTTLYIAAVATFMSYTPVLFGPNGPTSENQKTVLVPIMMLLLLVTSAAITGTLVFGRPVLMYLDGKKREALVFLGYTVAALFCMFIIAALALYAAVH